MFAKSQLVSLVLLAAAAIGVNAQALDTCIIQCSIVAAVVGNCDSYTDIACVCTSYEFQEAARNCITQNCPASDLANAEALQNLECSSCTYQPCPSVP
ncbi:hypothetical protein NM688_g7429 [Phlebia brevispora]|uniref:Uncharacterized protein n=1 Tax=Phlebia brevispora TaxID=194682 RepID=A0ACC1S580_9APHY|nr:hypothetical protein NM688_g7429 [Phlebia brevispora]